jgi:hypothetical protein
LIHLGVRFIFPDSRLGKIPFNCNFKYYLPENVKIACKARLISYALSFISPLFPLSIIILYYLFLGLFIVAARIFIPLYDLILKLLNVIKRIVDNLQSNLFVL